MKKYLARMKRLQTRQLYRKRSEIAEFPSLWAKAVKKWRSLKRPGTPDKRSFFTATS